MRDILSSNGFSYVRDCAICNGQAEEWVKAVNGKTALFKLRKTYTAGTLLFRGSVTRVQAHNLELILERNGLKETIQA